jgi:hypothetical protein
MKSFRDYVEEKELNEGVIDSFLGFIGRILGIGTAGVLSAWLAALLFKGGLGAVNSFSSSIGKGKELFKKNFKENIRESSAVKKELQEMKKVENKYEEELAEVINPLREKNYKLAAENFKNLPREKQNSTEIKRFVVSEIIKSCEQIPVSSPTPGNQAYQVIKKFYDLATAKAIAEAFQKEALKYATREE